MTKGNITKILFQFAAPLVASSLLQQLYNIADSMIAGNFIGENAVAAIGVSTSIVMFFTNVIIGFTTGVSIYIAQLTGRRDNEKIGEAIRTSFFYLVPAALLMALLSLGIIEQVLTMMHTDGSIFAMTKTYISIIFAGIPFVMVYNIC
ncbi:MAG: MATE family efflux transporter, partial [[Clostridium] symbiosum]